MKHSDKGAGMHVLGHKILMVCIAMGLVAAGSWAKGDMALTLDDGREVLLHDDNTWEFAQFTILEGEQNDIYIDVDDGRIICLKNDDVWSFVKRRPPRQKKTFAELPTVVSNGKATHSTLDRAVQAARNEAFTQAAKRLRPYAKKSKITQKYLAACIKNEVGEGGAEVTYQKGWTAKARLTLSKVQVKKILDCVEVQIEAAAQADTTSTKPATASAGLEK